MQVSESDTHNSSETKHEKPITQVEMAKFVGGIEKNF